MASASGWSLLFTSMSIHSVLLGSEEGAGAGGFRSAFNLACKLSRSAVFPSYITVVVLSLFCGRHGLLYGLFDIFCFLRALDSGYDMVEEVVIEHTMNELLYK